jgi:hypothetical protein
MGCVHLNRLSLRRLLLVPWMAIVSMGAEPASRPYAAAAYFSAGLGRESRLDVFPFDRKEFSIPLPFTLNRVVYGPDGRSLFVTAYDRPGVMKIDLKPVQVTSIPGSEVFRGAVSFAVSPSQNRIVVSGTISDHTCGVFDFGIPSGDLRMIPSTSWICTPLSHRSIGKDKGAFFSGEMALHAPWRVWTFSPDGKEVIVSSRLGFQVINLLKGSITALENAPGNPHWSPDGKWIGGIKPGSPLPQKTVLVDAKDPSRVKDLGGEADFEVAWSPDSQYILHAYWRPCGVTLETVDVETGKRASLKNSSCKVGLAREIGWVTSDLGR